MGKSFWAVLMFRGLTWKIILHRHCFNFKAKKQAHCRYKPSDYYLQELIEEWCEGVLQDNGHDQAEFTSSNKSELERPQSLLLEKIAAHLQKRVADILAIDVQGLTKVLISCLVIIWHNSVSSMA